MIANASVTSKTTISAPDLLWTNTAPTSSQFPAQTVTLPTGYSAFLVEFQLGSTGSSFQASLSTTYIPFGTSLMYATCGFLSFKNASTSTWREIKSASDGYIEFGKSGDGSGSFVIPRRIWGLKFTL